MAEESDYREEDVQCVMKYLDVIQEICTSPMSCHRIKRVEIVWETKYADKAEGDKGAWFMCPELRIEFIDAPMAKEVT